MSTESADFLEYFLSLPVALSLFAPFAALLILYTIAWIHARHRRTQEQVGMIRSAIHPTPDAHLAEKDGRK